MDDGDLAEGFMDASIAAEPQPFYRRARASGAVIQGSYGPQVVRREAIEYALAHPEEFSSGMDAVDLGQSVPLIPLQVDPPEHRKYRRLLDPIFAPRRMNVLEPDITRMVNELIDRFIDRGSCDFAAEFAVPLPSTVFLKLVGLPLSELDTFLEMKDGILRPSGNDLDEIQASQKASARRIEEYFAEAVKDRQKHRREDDILSLFLDAEVDSHRLTVDEILGICFLFILAGLDTVTDTLECMVARLAQHPDERRQIVDDPSIIPSAVEELLRWETPVTTVARKATSDVELGGCPIRAGESVGLVIGSANTDEESVPGADVVDLNRSPNRHLAFGGGVHRCLGSHLARLELRIALGEWHRRIPEYSIVPGTELEYQMGLRQIEALPLNFGPPR
jgi:cytochrome P450